MLSKRAFIYVILIFVAVLAFLVFLYFKNRLTISSEPLKAVPFDAAFIIRINDFRSLLKNTQKNNKIWEELRRLPAFSRMDQQIGFLDYINSEYPLARDLLFNKYNSSLSNLEN